MRSDSPYVDYLSDASEQRDRKEDSSAFFGPSLISEVSWVPLFLWDKMSILWFVPFLMNFQKRLV